MNVVSLIFVFASAITFISALIFYHINIKPINFLSKCGEWFLFKRGFNKKIYNSVNRKIALVYFALTLESCSFMIILYISNYAFTAGSNSWSYIIDQLLQKDSSVPPDGIFIYLLVLIGAVLILRLIFEFIIIPVYLSNKQIHQTNICTGQTGQQPTNTFYTQQNYTMPQSQTANMSIVNNISPLQAEQQSRQDSIAPETQFKFCSQCGTRYNAAEENCPNCGMK